MLEERSSILGGNQMPTLTVKGDWSKTKQFLNSLETNQQFSQLDTFGIMGVEALAEATPKRTGYTASCWNYEIEQNGNQIKIVWTNSNINKGENIAALLDSGHGTRSGFYISGRNYIDPALDPVLDRIIESIKEEVSRL